MNFFFYLVDKFIRHDNIGMEIKISETWVWVRVIYTSTHILTPTLRIFCQESRHLRKYELEVTITHWTYDGKCEKKMKSLTTGTQTHLNREDRWMWPTIQKRKIYTAWDISMNYSRTKRGKTREEFLWKHYTCLLLANVTDSLDLSWISCLFFTATVFFRICEKRFCQPY
jgi:hypothetical protein